MGRYRRQGRQIHCGAAQVVAVRYTGIFGCGLVALCLLAAAPLAFAHPFDPFAEDKQQALNLILAHMRDGETDEALLQADDAIRKFPKHGPFYTLKAQILLRASRSADALEAVNRAIVLAPKYALSYWVRGLVHQQQGAAAAALSDFDRAITLDDDSPAVRIQATGSRGMILVDLKRYREAIADLDRAIEVRPSAFAERTFRARAYLALGNPTGAQIDIDTLQQWSPHDATVLRLRGELELQQQRPAAAVTALTAALAVNPKDAHAYALRAAAHRQLGHTRQQRDDLRAACKWGEMAACHPAP